MAYTHLNPGNEIEISAHAYYYAGSLDISELIKQPAHELAGQEQASIDAEKAIFGQLNELEKVWVKQAAETVRLRQAMEYLRTPAVKHTSNQWVEGEYNWHECSNMVYKMTWCSYENTRYDHKQQKSVPVSWDLSWYLTYNTPNHPDNTKDGRQLAGQTRKHFGDKADLEKYLQGRIKAHAHFFEELSPPIPAGEEGRFSINGCLLPGYTVAEPERTPEEVAADLLAFLDTDDMEIEPAKETASFTHRKQPHHSKPDRSAPVR